MFNQHLYVAISQVARTFYLERSCSFCGLSFQVVVSILEVFDSPLSLRLILVLENGWNRWRTLVSLLTLAAAWVSLTKSTFHLNLRLDGCCFKHLFVFIAAHRMSSSLPKSSTCFPAGQHTRGLDRISVFESPVGGVLLRTTETISDRSSAMHSMRSHAEYDVGSYCSARRRCSCPFHKLPGLLRGDLVDRWSVSLLVDRAWPVMVLLCCHHGSFASSSYPV